MTTLYDNFFFNPSDTKIVDVNYTVPEGKFARIRPWQKSIPQLSSGNANASFPNSSFSINGEVASYFPSTIRKAGTNNSYFTYTLPTRGIFTLLFYGSGSSSILQVGLIDGASPTVTNISLIDATTFEYYISTRRNINEGIFCSNLSARQTTSAAHTMIFKFTPLHINDREFFAKSGTVITVSNLSLMIEEFDNPLGV